ELVFDDEGFHDEPPGRRGRSENTKRKRKRVGPSSSFYGFLAMFPFGLPRRVAWLLLRMVQALVQQGRQVRHVRAVGFVSPDAPRAVPAMPPPQGDPPRKAALVVPAPGPIRWAPGLAPARQATAHVVADVAGTFGRHGPAGNAARATGAAIAALSLDQA